MRGMGRLKEEDLSLGLEFSGIERSTNTRVFGVAKHALGTSCRPMYSFPTPATLTDEQAATIPVVYLTVFYALFHKANMKRGQSVLIHAGTGGVGMAAITVAQKRGLHVFTTCSKPKREFLKSKFGLADWQIGSSRSNNFVQTVIQATNGRRMNVVLNQLAGPLQSASLSCLAPGGHFCEIGKYDIMQNTGLGQAMLAANVSFHVIDLLPLLCDPREKPRWDKILSDGFARDEIVPLPTKVFEASDIIHAFRFMSQGKHAGKILITGFGREFPVEAASTALLAGELHIIVGGLGGLGLSLAGRLARDGCQRIVLVGRSGVANSFQRLKIRDLEKRGCQVQVLKSDVFSLHSQVCETPTKIWHAATVYDDVVLADMTKEKWDAVVRTKVDGYYNLRRVWPCTPIVAFSSVVAYFGNEMQTSYAFVNATLDSAARSDSLTLSVRLGPFDNVGFITHGLNHRSLFQRVPFKIMPIDSVLSSVTQIAVTHQSGVFGVYDWKTPFRSIADGNSSGGLTGIDIAKKVGRKKEIPRLQLSEPLLYTLEQAQKIVSVVLGGKADQYSATTSLKSAGLDSLSTMEIVHHIHEQSGSQQLKPSDIADRFTIQDMVDAINKERAKQNHFTDINEFHAHDETDEVETSRFKEQNTEMEPHEVSPVVQPDEAVGGLVTISIPPNEIDFDEIQLACSHADFIVLKQQDPVIFNHGAPVDSGTTDVGRFMDRYVGVSKALEKSKATVVAVIEGEVRGGGMLFPAMADVCIATPTATFGLPEIHRDMVPSVVSRALLERLGPSNTRRLSLTGESFDANEALRLGLVDHIVSHEEIDRHVENIVRRWKPRVKAARFIKSELLPKNPANAMAMETVAGQWLNQAKTRPLDDRVVLDVHITNGIGLLTMCDEKYQNTMTFEMTAAIRSAIPRLKKEARCIILASSLENFHVGLNPSRAREWKGRSKVDVAADMKECYLGFVELTTLGIPVIGVLNGKVYGGGLPIALWCDHRIVTADVDVHFGNISRGMSPAGQLSRLLREHLTPSQVMEAYLKNSHWNCDDLVALSIASTVTTSWDEAVHEATRLATFIAKQPTQGVRDTMHLLKFSYAADLADEESWLIAEKITDSNGTFVNHRNDAFQSTSKNIRAATVKMSSRALDPKHVSSVGIVAMEVYTPAFAIQSETLEEHGIPAKTKQGQEAVAVWDDQEDSISMALNAVSQLLAKHVDNPYKIGRLEVGTESNVDMAKSIKSYLMSLLPTDHCDVEGVDNINACYGGTAALLNSLAWCQQTGKYAIVVSTDTADMDLPQSGWRGAVAVAMLVGRNPWIEIHPERVSCFKHTSDFLKPRHSQKISPYIQTKASMDHYLYALDYTITQLYQQHKIEVGQLDAFVFHGGL